MPVATLHSLSDVQFTYMYSVNDFDVVALLY